jgi:hypothetical protein
MSGNGRNQMTNSPARNKQGDETQAMPKRAGADRTAILAAGLARGRTIKQAAREAGYSERQAHRKLTEPEREKGSGVKSRIDPRPFILFRRGERGAIGYHFCPGQQGEAVSQGETVSRVGNMSGTVLL